MRNKKAAFKLRDKKITIFIGVFLSLFLIFGLSDLALAGTETLRPNASGTDNNWTASSAGDWQDTSDEDDATYVYSTADESTETNAIVDPTFGVTDTIESVTVYAKAGVSGGSGPAEKAATYILSGSTYNEGTATTVSRLPSYTTLSTAYTTDPDTGVAWTKTGVTNLEIGVIYKQGGATEEIRATEFWVVVVYTPSGASVWDNGQGGNSTWGAANNWNPNGVPGAGADVIFRGSVTSAGCTIDANTNAVGTIFAEDDYIGTITQNGGNVTVAGDFILNNGDWAMTASETITMTGDGNFKLASGVTFTYATSTVDLQGTGQIQSYDYNVTLYNLTCAAAAKTTTLVGSAGFDGIDVYGTLTTASTGTLTDNDTNQKIRMRDGSTVVNGGTIDVVELEFILDDGRADLGGGDYGSTIIQSVSGGMVTLGGDVTASGGWRAGYLYDNWTCVINLNGYDITTTGNIDIGESGQTTRVGQITSGNILPNADFEAGTVGANQVPDGWAGYELETDKYGIANDQGRGQSWYAIGDVAWSSPLEGSNIHPDVGVSGGAIHTSVEANKEYTFEAYFKTDSTWDGEATVTIQFLTSDGSTSWDPVGDPIDSHVEANVVYPSAGTDWTLETCSGTAPATATHAQFAFEIYSEGTGAGTIYVDDIWAGLTSATSSDITAANIRVYPASNAGYVSSIDLESGVHTFSGNVTIDAPSAGAEAHLTILDGTLNAAGNWSNSGTFTANRGTVNFNGSAAQTLTGTMTGAGKFYNLTITNDAASPGDTVDVDPDAAVEVANTLTVTDGQFQPNTSSDFVDVSIGASGILKPDASASITVSGDWTNSGAFTHNSGTVTLDGTAAQSVTTGGSNWSTLTVTNASTVNFLDGFTTANLTAATNGTTLKFKNQTASLTDVFEITANNGLTLNPGVGNNITLDRYDGAGTDQWEIYPSGTGWDVDYVTVSNSINSAGTEIGTGTNLDNSTDGGNNINWFTASLVDMVSFWAIGYFDKAEVGWKTASEINNAGFNIYRSTTAHSGYIKINDDLIPGLGSSVIGREYSFWDYEVANGITYYYKLEDVEFDGTSTMHGPLEVHPGLDSDGDGMTDDWENYYGLNPYLDDSQADPDQDGLTNLEEFVAETDPLTKFEIQIVAENPAQEPLRIIASNDNHIVMELVTTSFDLEDKTGNGEAYKLITIPDYIHGYTSEIGKPQLPAKGVLVGVPQGASANIGGSDYSSKEYKTTYNIYPVPEITEVEGQVERHLEEEFAIDQAAYSKDEYYPGNLVEVVYTGELRSQRVASIRFYPFQFNPNKGSLKFYDRIRVEIVFGGAGSSSDSEISGIAVPANDEPYLKLALKEEGIYRLTGYDLVDAGLSLFWIDPETIKLYNLGEEIAIKVNGEADGRFDPDDEIIFFAEALDTKYSATNVYWLTYGGENGLRMEEALGSEDDASATPDKFLSLTHYEEDEFYWTELEGGEDTNRWFFNTFIWGGREKDFNIDLANIVIDEAHQAKIKFTIHGFFDVKPYPNHHALIYLNGHLLDEAFWSGQTEYTLERDDIPQSYFVDGTNTITVKALLAEGASYDLILANYFEFEYWKNLVAEGDISRFNYEGEGTHLFEIPGFTSGDIEIFDITDEREVMYLTNFEINDAHTVSFKDSLSGEKEYIALTDDAMLSPDSIEVDESSDLRAASNQADYIIITDEEFYYAVLSLAYLRESLGLSTEVVKIDDVYDEFNFGIQSPYAIKNFLKFAYNNWQRPAPTYVLLVGDASYDYKDNLGKGKSNYVPTYLLWTPYAGETGSDNWFVCLDGEEDILPDMFIGRIPVRTYEEAQAVVEKIMDYEEKSGREEWMEKAVIVADNELIFEEISDALIELLPDKFETSKLYIRYHPHPEVLTQKMVAEINEGALILNYAGHGSAELWADEQILDTSTIDLFNNADRLPIVVSMTCLDGFYLHAQQYPSMAETFLKKEQGGAVGTWSSTGMGLPQGHQILNKSLYEAFFDDNNTVFGSATTQAKISLFLQDGKRYNDLIHTYTLFGDPSLRLKIEKKKTPLPVVTIKEVGKTVQIQAEEEAEEASGFEAIFDDVIENYDSAKIWRDKDKEAEGSYELPGAFEGEGAEGDVSLGPAIGAEGEVLLEDDSIERPNYKPARLIGKVSEAEGEHAEDITNLQESDNPEIIMTEPAAEDTLQIEQADNGGPSKNLWVKIREAVRRFFERLHSRFIREEVS